jgi:hypothetical protein
MESAVRTPNRLRRLGGVGTLSERQERAREMTSEVIAANPEGGKTAMLVLMGSLEIVAKIGTVAVQISGGAASADPPLSPVAMDEANQLIDLLIGAFPW